MQDVADVADTQAGAGAHFFVGEAIVELEPDQLAAAFVEGFETEPDQADAFPAGDLFVGQRLRVGGLNWGRRGSWAPRPSGTSLSAWR